MSLQECQGASSQTAAAALHQAEAVCQCQRGWQRIWRLWQWRQGILTPSQSHHAFQHMITEAILHVCSRVSVRHCPCSAMETAVGRLIQPLCHLFEDWCIHHISCTRYVSLGVQPMVGQQGCKSCRPMPALADR